MEAVFSDKDVRLQPGYEPFRKCLFIVSSHLRSKFKGASQCVEVVASILSSRPSVLTSFGSGECLAELGWIGGLKLARMSK